MIYVIANYSDVYPLLTFACARQRAELKPIIVLPDESSTVSRPIIGFFAALTSLLAAKSNSSEYCTLV
jgi:hypothetical protein